MRRPTSFLLTGLVAFFVLFAAAGARAQDVRYVHVRTNHTDASLFADSLEIGPVTDAAVAVPIGTRVLRLVPHGFGGWSVPPVTAALTPGAGDTVAVRLDFPYRYRVETMPYGATVHLEDEAGWTRLGTTPLVYTSEQPLSERLVIEKAGFVLVRAEPGTSLWNIHRLTLQPVPDAAPDAARVDWRPPRQRRAWIDYAAIGTAVAAGAVAVHYKFKADRLYARYQETTDPGLRPQIKEYDTYSAVSLGVMQAGIGLFAIRLILR